MATRGPELARGVYVERVRFEVLLPAHRQVRLVPWLRVGRMDRGCMVTWKTRSELRPGDMFVWYPTALTVSSDVLVVLDAKTEVGFWRGGEWCLGDVAPSYKVCVL